ncbi:MAG TPA: DUF2125 domain-containing protein [Alphaproteobacteria bacterium]|jgi:hypothetical protein|nr:DUF2125 domain-containing protein [Alphaproteobacteria bacterium]
MRYLALVAAVVLAALAWTGYWFYAAHRVEDGVEAWAAHQRAQGMQVSWEGLKVSGFPFRIRVDVAAPHLAWPREPGAPEWRSPHFAAIVQPWYFRHVVADLSGTQYLSAIDQGKRAEVEISADKGLGSFSNDSNGRLERLSIDLHEAKVVADGATLLTAGRLQAHARGGRHAEEMIELAFTTSDAVLPTDGGTRLGKRVEAAELLCNITGNLPQGSERAAIARWRDDGGTVEVQTLRLDWGPLHLNATGTVALDEQMRPIGSLTAKVRGYEALIDSAVERGQMERDKAHAAKSVLGLLAKAGGGTLSVPVTMQNGVASLGPVAVGRLKPLL